MKHRSPKAGYISNVKQEYRDSVWSEFKRSGAISRAIELGMSILILPGLQSDEIDTAIKHGIPVDRIVCVHESEDAVLKSAEWLVKWPNIKYYCCKVSDVGEKLKADRISLCAANLDFCNNFSMELVAELRGFVLSDALDYESVVSVNIQKGRESSSVVEMLINGSTRMKHNTKEKRIAMLLDMAIPNDITANIISEGDYFVSTPMHFSTFTLKKCVRPGVTIIRGKLGVRYRAQVMVDGERRSKVFHSPEQASAFVDAVKRNRGALSVTVRDAVNEFCRATKSTDKSLFNRLDYWVDRLGKKMILELSPDDIQGELIRLILEGKSPATVDRYKSAISVSITNAATSCGVPIDNPCRKVASGKVISELYM